MKRLIHSLLVVGLAAGIHTTAMADGTAVFQTADASMPSLTFSWQTPERSRLDTPNETAHVLAIDGKAWGVAKVAGHPVTMDLDQLATLLGQQNALSRLGPDAVVPSQITSLEPTGQRETIAGVDGERYRVSWVDSEGQARIDEAVLTEDPLVKEMQLALLGGMTRAIARGTGVTGHEAAEQELKRRGLAVLRFGDDFRLESISDARQPDERFAMPSKPVDLQQIMRGVMGN
ncbi:hypothetical protein D5687_10100 [Guyparkeria sp. SCN-R1]|uniref:hypothetical protein n=1 Tax=unclassified Guyparkeria TaxID=2626246 RepID=UPI000F64EEA3|nr:hypothetical protein [Guyparkeria sp. SCN-R1]RRQ20299.1 hypothetical protein D5687_10100 [Guyparkeria sp. SCN-R1]